MPAASRRHRAAPDIWPGFVDAISALLIIVIFLLMVFTLAQYFLAETLSGRDAALERLNRQVSQLAEMLSIEKTANTDLRNTLSQVSGQLQTSTSERDRLSNQLAEMMPERDMLQAMLKERTTEVETFSSLLGERTAERDGLKQASEDARKAATTAGKELEDAYKAISADKEIIELQLRRIASLERDITALSEVRAALEKKIAAQTASFDDQAKEAGALRDRSKELVAALATQRERTLLVQNSIEEKDIRLKALLRRAGRAEDALSEEEALSQQARDAVRLLNAQIAALRHQLGRISAALETSEVKASTQNIQIVNLSKRLNEALASKVQELASFRSEFFGRLRKALGNRRDIRVVGDRFVFQSEVLFHSGAASLQDSGRGQINKLAQTLIGLSARIPKDINWVLRVDGHTDRLPIATVNFPSNWELSTARAVSVVKFMIELGLPPNRLAATGFGEFQPLDRRNTVRAFRRNRRIEFKLTQR